MAQSHDCLVMESSASMSRLRSMADARGHGSEFGDASMTEAGTTHGSCPYHSKGCGSS